MPMVITNPICSVLVPIPRNPDAFGLIMTGIPNLFCPTWNPKMIRKWGHLIIQILMLIWMEMGMLTSSSRQKIFLRFGISENGKEDTLPILLTRMFLMFFIFNSRRCFIFLNRWYGNSVVDIFTFSKCWNQRFHESNTEVIFHQEIFGSFGMKWWWHENCLGFKFCIEIARKHVVIF